MSILLCLLAGLGAQDASAPATPPARGGDALVFEGATVHTLVPGEPARLASVLVRGDRIVAVGTDLEVPEDARRLDVSGRHLIPSLIDAYVNFDPAHDLHYTVAGVGLVRDVGGNHVQVLAERDEERRARALGPALLSAGALLDGDPPSSSSAAVLRDAAAAEALLPILIDGGVDFLSIYQRLTPEARRKVLELGHAAGLEVWGPLPADLDLAGAVAEGVDGLHFLDALLPLGVGWPVVQPPAFDASIRALVESNTPLIPLYQASALRLDNQLARAESGPLLDLLSPTYEFWWRNELALREGRMSRETLESGQRALDKQRAVLGRLHEAGARLVPGSGAPQPWLFPGRALHEELAQWARAGIPAPALLESVTRGAAEVLGVAGRHGSLEPGATASLLVLEQDPTVDITALGTIESILVRGRLLQAEDLDDLLTTVRVREAKAREALDRELVVEAEPLPEGAVTILEGLVETRSVGMRLSVERYRVAQLEGERLLFHGHVVFPYAEGEPRREVLISQITREGRLEAVEVTQRLGASRVSLEGLWTAGSWRMQQSAGLKTAGVKTTPNRPVLVDVGSVTTFLVLGMAPLAERFPIISLHDGLEPEEAFWNVELDNAGQHQVRTHVGQLAFRLNELGGIDRALVVAGSGVIETDGQEVEAFGGPGLLLPLEKRRAIRELQAAAAAAEAAATPEAQSAPEAETANEDG